MSGGNVISDGGAVVTARGVCYSTSSNPTISSNITTNGNGTGSYISNLTGLSPNTKYYVRAYATNSQGTSYGNQISFTTNSIGLSPVIVSQILKITYNPTKKQSPFSATSFDMAPRHPTGRALLLILNR